MLIDFTISNYRSIKESQTLSFLATKDKELLDNIFEAPNIDKTSLLKSAVIYGANGSGKTNVLKALQQMDRMVRDLGEARPEEKPLARYYDPFRLDKDFSDQGITFEIEFLSQKNTRYRYSFTFDRNVILEESLFFYPKKQEAKLFIRKKGQPIDFGESLTGNKKSIENLLLPHQLFLSKGAANNNTILMDAHSYFLLMFPLMMLPNGNSKEVSDLGTDFLLKRTSILESLKTLLQNADIGVQDIILQDSPEESEGEPKKVVRTSRKIFQNGDYVSNELFTLEQESEGTRRLYGIGSILLMILSLPHSVVILDEIEASLHPLITELLVKLFYNKETNPHNNQLVFSTHNTTMLRSELFRRDQIWFTEKDNFGATSLYSLSDFDKSKVRKDIPYDKWYLSGRFGGLPLVKDFELNKSYNAKTKEE